MSVIFSSVCVSCVVTRMAPSVLVALFCFVDVVADVTSLVCIVLCVSFSREDSLVNRNACDVMCSAVARAVDVSSSVSTCERRVVVPVIVSRADSEVDADVACPAVQPTIQGTTRLVLAICSKITN